MRTTALAGSPAAGIVASTLAAALGAVDPYQAVVEYLRRDGEMLVVNERVYDLGDIRQIYIVGAGKAACAMLSAAVDVLGDRLDGGAVVTKYVHEAKIGSVEVLPGGHPLPTPESVSSAQRLVTYLQDRHPQDLVICLISGGGSALLVAPVPGISLLDLQTMTSSLLACGATIHEINTLRKHLDQIKGGGLVRLAAPAQIVSLILSDVIGNPLDVIASGPTVADSSSFTDAWNIVQKYDLEKELLPAIRVFLKGGLAGKRSETPKPGDSIFERTQNVLVGSNHQAALAGLTQARMYGLNTLLLTTYLQGEARSAGQMLAALARQIAATGEPLPRPACIAVGGETTVTLRGKGRGGRNQELTLGALTDLAGLENVALVALGTDGEDGPTDAAGAVITGESLSRSRQIGLDPVSALEHNDSYTFFDQLGDLLRPGATGTNVNDLAFLFAF